MLKNTFQKLEYIFGGLLPIFELLYVLQGVVMRIFDLYLYWF